MQKQRDTPTHVRDTRLQPSSPKSLCKTITRVQRLHNTPHHTSCQGKSYHRQNATASRLSTPTLRVKAHSDQEVKVMGSIVLYMYANENTDRVIWQVTDTTGAPILGRTQAKLMNYISYPEIHTPLGQGQSPVSADSLKSTDYIYSLGTTNSSLQSAKTVQSTDSLKTTSTTDQTAQEEHRSATSAKSSTAHGPKYVQV